MKATAVANANIALVKYWGKRNDELILPANSSISMTCGGLMTTTTVEFSEKFEEDSVTINDEELAAEKDAVVAFLDLVRQQAKTRLKAKVVSSSNFPMAAGLASSASGFAALALAASEAAGLKLNEKELSILARRGSGSASRSVAEGFVEWHKGNRNDGSDSFAESVVKADYWPEFRMITTIVAETKKKISSRAGMSQTVKTSPYYEGWLNTVDADLTTVRNGIKERDFSATGSCAQQNCLKMHATMITTKPSIVYWQPATMEIIHSVLSWREEGSECYFTIDAGPNVKVMCLDKNEKELRKRLEMLEGVKKTITCRPGDGARLTDNHLF
ncbi:MAG: diphosphomevalonate decarboxylase [Candidatus Aenigmarchaeota archaeon]|nr:diphosphomevalonate decarboxylase [Candidatus Aenigmarchaeota archaeon]